MKLDLNSHALATGYEHRAAQSGDGGCGELWTAGCGGIGTLVLTVQQTRT